MIFDRFQALTLVPRNKAQCGSRRSASPPAAITCCLAAWIGTPTTKCWWWPRTSRASPCPESSPSEQPPSPPASQVAIHRAGSPPPRAQRAAPTQIPGWQSSSEESHRQLNTDPDSGETTRLRAEPEPDSSDSSESAKSSAILL